MPTPNGKKKSNSTNQPIIPLDVIARRHTTAGLGLYVEINEVKSVVKHSATIPVKNCHHIPVQSYSPEGEVVGIIFYFPGTASIANCSPAIHNHSTQMAKIFKCHVIVVHVRLVPENKHPVPYNDAVKVINHLMAHGSQELLDQQGRKINFQELPIAISGYSSGGLLATHIYLNSFKENIPSLFCQLIAIAPIVNVNELEHLVADASSQLVYEEIFSRFPQDYLPEGGQLQQPEFHSPQYMKLPAATQMPKITIVIGKQDLLYPQNEIFYDKLKQHGLEYHASFYSMEGCDHGMTWKSEKHLELVADEVIKNMQWRPSYPLEWIGKMEIQRKAALPLDAYWQHRYGNDKHQFFKKIDAIYPARITLWENTRNLALFDMAIGAFALFDSKATSSLLVKIYCDIKANGEKYIGHLIKLSLLYPDVIPTDLLSNQVVVWGYYNQKSGFIGLLAKLLLNKPEKFKAFEHIDIVLPIAVHHLDALKKTMSYHFAVLVNIFEQQHVELLFGYLLGMSYCEFAEFLFHDASRDTDYHVSLDELSLLMTLCPRSLKRDLFIKLNYCKLDLAFEPFLKLYPQYRECLEESQLSRVSFFQSQVESGCASNNDLDGASIACSSSSSSY